jgi:hypothetical protein
MFLLHKLQLITPMKRILSSLVILVSLATATSVTAAVDENFSSLSESFWDISSTTTATHAAPLPYASGGFLKMVTEPQGVSGVDSGTQTLKIVSVAADPSLTFLGDQVLSFEVDNVSIDQYAGTSSQAWPNLQFGLGTSTGALSGQSASIYFQVYSPTGASQLVLRGNGASSSTVLWTGTSLSYDSISITLTATTWSYIINNGTEVFSDAGTHSASTNSAWTDSTGLYSQVYLNANTIRDWVTDVSVDSFYASSSAIPESSSTAAVVGLLVLALVVSRRIRK